MFIDVELEDGMLPDEYGKYAGPEDQAGRLSRRSFPFDVVDIPEGAKALAVLFFDWDSVPVCGFPWIHWCAVLGDVEGCDRVEVVDDLSRQGAEGVIQGYNSAAKGEPEVGTGYVGPCPPDKDHVYTLRVYALDYDPIETGELAEPFWSNEMIDAVRGHMLAHAQVNLPSRA